MHEDNHHRTHRHVKLPGGRQIEVVYLDGAPEHTMRSPATSGASASRSNIDAGEQRRADRPRMTQTTR